MNIRRHLLLLTGSIAIWIAIPTLAKLLGLQYFPGFSSVFGTLFLMQGLAGATHATTVVLAFDNKPQVIRQIVFVLFAGVIACLNTWFAVYLAIGARDLFFSFLVASAGGVTAYWWLIRRLLLPTLPRGVLLHALIACPIATVIGFAAAKVIGIDVATLAWWLAFSLCLCSGIRSKATANPSLNRDAPTSGAPVS